MLYDLIDHDLIDVVNHDIDAWEDAVKTTTRYLEQKGYVTANYADAIGLRDYCARINKCYQQ